MKRDRIRRLFYAICCAHSKLLSVIMTSGKNAAVVRNGNLQEREIVTGVGPVAGRVPKVHSRDSDPVVFHSKVPKAMSID